MKGTQTGCFVGTCFKEEHESVEDAAVCPANPVTSDPARVSHFFGLKGPIAFIDTACGSSLSAFAEAFHAIQNGICESALVIGVNSLFRARISVAFRDLGMVNGDGKCKCLSADADGYCRSEAIAVSFLQSKSKAKRIYAEILNCKANADGYKDEGITFPSR